MEIGKTFCGRTDGRTEGRTHLSSNLLGHRRGDDLKTGRLTLEAPPVLVPVRYTVL